MKKMLQNMTCLKDSCVCFLKHFLLYIYTCKSCLLPGIVYSDALDIIIRIRMFVELHVVVKVLLLTVYHCTIRNSEATQYLCVHKKARTVEGVQ